MSNHAMVQFDPILASYDLCSLIDSVGEDRFSRQLISALHNIAGAEHCAVLGFRSGVPFKITAASLDGTDLAEKQIDLYLKNYWRMDPTMVSAASAERDEDSHLMRLDPDCMPPSALRDIVYRRGHVSERLLIWDTADTLISLSIVRSERSGKFSSDDLEHLERMSRLLLSIARKHSSLLQRRSDFYFTLNSLNEIMDCITSEHAELSRREAEVCGRILYGQSSRLIALELDISEETVKTYRRRAYERLGISTQRELLGWFASLWSNNEQQIH